MSFLFSLGTKHVKDKISKTLKHDLYNVIGVHDLNYMILDYCSSIDEFIITIAQTNKNILYKEQKCLLIEEFFYDTEYIKLDTKNMSLRTWRLHIFNFIFYWFDQIISQHEINEQIIQSISIRCLSWIKPGYDIFYYDPKSESYPVSIFFSKKCFFINLLTYITLHF